jgi:hypothetical protein
MAEGKWSGAYLSLIAVALSELRRDTRMLLETGWEESVRRRAHELASTLAEACDRRGLKDVATLCRSAAHLAHLPKSEALPLEAALREKFESLHREAEKLLSVHMKRGIG